MSARLNLLLILLLMASILVLGIGVGCGDDDDDDDDDDAADDDDDSGDDDDEDTEFPQEACDQFSEGTVEQKEVVDVFDDVFDETYHADLDVPVEVTLPDNAESYIHFPVFQSGEYVVFLDTEGVFDTVYDRNEVEASISGGVPNGVCPDVLTDHYHVGGVVYDGDGESPVPYVIKFKAVSAQTIRFIIKYHE